MSTKTKSGIGAGGALAVCVAIIIGVGFLYGVVRKGPSDERSIVAFEVFFSPSGASRVTNIDIVVSIDGTFHAHEATKKSGWRITVPLKRGQVAVLTATQTVPSQLSCKVNGEVQETRAFPGSVTCKHRRA